MELRAYGQLFKRRWPFVVIPALVVLAVGLATYTPPGLFYTVGVRFLVGQAPSAAADLEDEERLANWQTSEYIVNGVADWVNGTYFSQRVSDRLKEQGLDVPHLAIFGGLRADNTRSMLQLSLNYPDRATLEAMVRAATAVLLAQNAEGIPQLGGISAEIIPLDEPIINAIPAPITNRLDLPIRLAVALAAGFGLALLVDYLDHTVRDRRELEALHLPVLGEIPKK